MVSSFGRGFDSRQLHNSSIINEMNKVILFNDCSLACEGMGTFFVAISKQFAVGWWRL